jgi:hypothetical protein
MKCGFAKALRWKEVTLTPGRNGLLPRWAPSGVRARPNGARCILGRTARGPARPSHCAKLPHRTRLQPDPSERALIMRTTDLADVTLMTHLDPWRRADPDHQLAAAKAG